MSLQREPIMRHSGELAAHGIDPGSDSKAEPTAAQDSTNAHSRGVLNQSLPLFKSAMEPHAPACIPFNAESLKALFALGRYNLPRYGL